MSGSAALLLALDLLATYAKGQMEIQQIMQKAALEGRSLDMDDVKGLIAQSDESRSKFDEAVKKHRGEI
jgi:hypothetical protein